MAKKFLHHSTSSFLVPCSIFKTTQHQFPGRRPNGMLTRVTRARKQTIAKKIPSSFNFLIPCSLFNIPNNFMSVPRPEAYWYAHSRDASEDNDSEKNSFIIQLPHSLFLVQYLKQPHISSQAGGLLVCSLAGREREQR